MVRRTYGEGSKNLVEESIDDKKVIERFVAQLEDKEEALTARDFLSSSNSVEATASYQLEHPYEGENFWEYSLPNNEEVSAQVVLKVEAGHQEKRYEGRIFAKAYDIFHPSDHVNKLDSGEAGKKTNNEAQKEVSNSTTTQTD